MLSFHCNDMPEQRAYAIIALNGYACMRLDTMAVSGGKAADDSGLKTCRHSPLLKESCITPSLQTPCVQAGYHKRGTVSHLPTCEETDRQCQGESMCCCYIKNATSFQAVLGPWSPARSGKNNKAYGKESHVTPLLLYTEVTRAQLYTILPGSRMRCQPEHHPL